MQSWWQGILQDPRVPRQPQWALCGARGVMVPPERANLGLPPAPPPSGQSASSSPPTVRSSTSPPHKAPGAADRAARARAPPSAPPRRSGPRRGSRSRRRAARGGRCDPGGRAAVPSGAGGLGAGRERDFEPGKDVAEARGGAAEERPQAVGHAEEQRLLYPAAASGPRRRWRPLHGYLVARGFGGAPGRAGPSRAGPGGRSPLRLPHENLASPGHRWRVGLREAERPLCSDRARVARLGDSAGRRGSLPRAVRRQPPAARWGPPRLSKSCRGTASRFCSLEHR